MNKKLLIIVGLMITLGLAIYVFFLFRSFSTQPPITGPDSPGSGNPTFPPGTGNNGGNTTGNNPHTNNTFSITTSTGKDLQVKDFKKDSATIKDTINEGYYYLGYHFGEGQIKNPPYVIEYIDQTQIFNIGLFQEPIAQSRREAEQYLMAALGISQNEMCQLQYMVSVPYDVNEFYTSRNLGFSFCPGSVVIPE